MTEFRRLDLNLVIMLDALLAERNLTRAAERLGLTQAALSTALAKLRTLFADPLLVREGRLFVLTPLAESLIPKAAACVEDITRTFDMGGGFDSATTRRTFVVSASDYVLSELTAPLLGLFSRTAPQARVEFEPLRVDAIVTPEDLLRRDVTIAATGRHVPGKRASLFTDQFVPVVDRRNPHVIDGALDLETLAALPMVRADFGPQTSTHVDDMLRSAGIAPHAAVTVQGLLLVPFMLVGTPWLGWVPERTARRFAESLGLAIVSTPIAPHVIVEAAHWHPSKTGDPGLEWLLAQLRLAAEVVEFGAVV